MRRIISFLVVAILTAQVSAFAQEDSDFEFKNRFSFGGGGMISPGLQGGFIDFGFGLYSNETKTFFIRNHIEINSAAISPGSSIGIFGIRERVFIGSSYPMGNNTLLMYGIVDVGFSALLGDKALYGQNAFNDAYIVEPRGGFGFSIVVKNKGSFFVEMLGGSQILLNTSQQLSKKYTGASDTYVTFNIGGRGFF